MTKGIDNLTLDGMSLMVIIKIIDQLKDESFQFNPGRRIQIPKASWGKRPLTFGSTRDKLVQEVMRMVLEAIYEPTFSVNFHGFRPNRSCNSDLRQVFTKFKACYWVIEGDISKCFDSIDHKILMSLIDSKIEYRRFTRLISKALKVGYLDFKVYRDSINRVPHGSIISPIFANIFLNQLDLFIQGLKE